MSLSKISVLLLKKLAGTPLCSPGLHVCPQNKHDLGLGVNQSTPSAVFLGDSHLAGPHLETSINFDHRKVLLSTRRSTTMYSYHLIVLHITCNVQCTEFFFFLGGGDIFGACVCAMCCYRTFIFHDNYVYFIWGELSFGGFSRPPYQSLQ